MDSLPVVLDHVIQNLSNLSTGRWGWSYLVRASFHHFVIFTDFTAVQNATWVSTSVILTSWIGVWRSSVENSYLRDPRWRWGVARTTGTVSVSRKTRDCLEVTGKMLLLLFTAIALQIQAVPLHSLRPFAYLVFISVTPFSWVKGENWMRSSTDASRIRQPLATRFKT